MSSETNKWKTVSTGPAQVVRTDFKTMTVAMQGDDSEIYLVQWHTVSADDGDPDIGAFTFTVSTSPQHSPQRPPRPQHRALASARAQFLREIWAGSWC
jgi:hypothetical protein